MSTNLVSTYHPTSLTWQRLPFNGRFDSGGFFQQHTDPNDPPANPPTPPPANQNPGDPDELGDKGKAALERERAAAKAADKRAKDAEAELATLRAAQKKREDDDAAQQGQWQKLADDRQAEIDKLKADADAKQKDLEAQIAKRDRDDRARAALKAEGLDEALLPRLIGDTDDELKADAKTLAKVVKAAAPKPGNPTNPDPAGPTSQKTEADNIALARRTSRL